MPKKKPNNDRNKYKKLPIEDRVQMVESLYIHFPRNEKTLNAIREHHAHAKFASEPEGLLIQGETSAGKTTIIKLYLKDYPRTNAEEITTGPVLCARVPTPTPGKQLVTKLVEAISYPPYEV